MGANAQTSVLDFTNGQVLTGPEMDISAGTGVPVFATTVTRDAAFGGANKVLAEGQTCYLEDANVVQYYDGAAWATVGPAAAGALVRVGGGSLSVSSTQFTNIFSATYDTYKIVVSNYVATNSTDLEMILGATTTGYYAGMPGLTYAGATQNVNRNNAASWRGLAFTGAGTSGSSSCELTNPFLSKLTAFVSTDIQFTTGGAAHVGGGFLNNTTSYTAFTFSVTAGTFTGTVNIYGYALS